MHRIPENRPPTPPGEVFLEIFLRPLGITQKEAARRLRISYPRMNEIVNGKRSVTPETALRLARFTNTEAETWLNLQQTLDLWRAREGQDREEILEIEPVPNAETREAIEEARRRGGAQELPEGFLAELEGEDSG